MKIGIVGAGLAGLSCAWHLKKKGFGDLTLFEASDRAGGKLKTDVVNGFKLDRGFQVLLPSYPEAKIMLDFVRLRLQYFDKGALILKKGKMIPFYDPQNGIKALLETVLNGPGSLWDKVKLLGLKWELGQKSVEDILKNGKSADSLTYLRDYGFGKSMIEDFWVPFYQGVFLENHLSTSSKMLQFTFKMFADAGAAVPAEGMEAISKQLVEFVGSENIRLNTKVASYDAQQIKTSDGESSNFDVVVLACAVNENVAYHSVTNVYYETDVLPFNSKHVILNANADRKVNNVVFISNVAPSYSSGNRHLVSVSANGILEDANVLVEDLVMMFGEQVRNWRMLNTYVIKEALPVLDKELSYQPEKKDGIYRCGDYLIQGSIDGALKSGRLVAEAIVRGV